ncbi:MAG TPA: RNA pseudouridine synthase [Rhabdochlamydiaceae bacterium]|nr:RNA pseudouridine synthase [Rhabdochlamydiaceae bacterium]
MELECIFSDNHLLVVNKPAGLSTQSDKTAALSLHQLAKDWIKISCNKPGAVFLEPVHRLDRPVSGLVLFARTSKALSRLNAQMREKKIIKTYFAHIEGALPEQQGTLEHFLIHDDHCARIANENDPSSKKAILNYRTLDQNSSESYVEITLVTGRYHQIRAQMAAMGCPIIGDLKYGSKFHFSGEGIALHHGRLECIHPVTKESLSFHTDHMFPSSIQSFL